MGVPGPFDRQSGELLVLPGMSGSWHGPWRGLRLVEHLGNRFGCPVYVENDANCAALAEAHFGIGRGARTVVYYSVSTGVGGGVVRDGALFIGRHDTEMGHQVLWPKELGGPQCACGSHGCLEAVVGGEALQRRFGQKPEEIDDPSVWEEVGRWLGLAVVNTTALLDPDIVVFGGGVCARWPLFAPAMRATIATTLRLRPAPRVELSGLDADRGLWGALMLVPDSLRANLP
jgi:glucokinase